MNAQTQTAEAATTLQEDIYGLSPLELILVAYDVAIEGCRMQDANKASKSLVELIAALNFEHRDVAMGLFRLYDYCLRRVKAGDFEGVLTVLQELRETWAKSAQQQQRREAV